MFTGEVEKKSLLNVTDLTVYYGSVKALNNVSFYVDEGEIVAMVGPNGAGKSTALNAVSGVLKDVGGSIKSGEILFKDESIKDLRTDELVRKGMSLVPEGRRVFYTMTVLENLEIGAYIRNDISSIKDDIDMVFNLFPELKDKKDKTAGTLSSGEQQMLAIGRALMLKPMLLLADEPSLGLSPNYVDIIFDKLVEINKNQTSILLVEQNARMALEICHRGYIFDVGPEGGFIDVKGSREMLIRDEKVKRLFLSG